jgi:hypothetical protein
MKIITINAAILIFAFLPAIGYSQSNFTGKWTFDLPNSKMDSVPTYAVVKEFNITQDQNSITINRVLVNAKNEETTSSETIRLDGTPQTIILSDGRAKTNTLTWSDDKKILTTVSVYQTPGSSEGGYTLAQRWVLCEEGDHLKVNLQSPTYQFTAVYDKK